MARPDLQTERSCQRERRRAFSEAFLAFSAFCGLSLLSRLVPLLFLLVVALGILFPLLWGAFTKDWKTMGFTRRGLGKALGWGATSGLLLMAVIWFSSEHKLDPFFALQLIVGVPAWMLVVSPFQEFFFRGWLQPRFEKSLGMWPGLLVASLCFAVWHLCPAFEQAEIVPIRSVSGMLFTTGMGLVFGYTFCRTRSIWAPWLAHVLAGLTLVLSGAMAFVQYVE